MIRLLAQEISVLSKPANAYSLLSMSTITTNAQLTGAISKQERLVTMLSFVTTRILAQTRAAIQKQDACSPTLDQNIVMITIYVPLMDALQIKRHVFTPLLIVMTRILALLTVAHLLLDVPILHSLPCNLTTITLAQETSAQSLTVFNTSLLCAIMEINAALDLVITREDASIARKSVMTTISVPLTLALTEIASSLLKFARM
jgi:hypothetical protein